MEGYWIPPAISVGRCYEVGNDKLKKSLEDPQAETPVQRETPVQPTDERQFYHSGWIRANAKGS